MAANRQSVTIDINVAGHIEKFSENIKKIQSELNKLHLAPGLKDTFSGIFISLDREIQNIQNKTGKGKLNIVDEKSIQRSLGNIDNLYGNLIKKLSSQGVKTSLLEKDHKAIQAMTTAAANYGKAVRQNVAEEKKLTDAVEKRKKALDAQKSKKVVSDAEAKQLKTSSNQAKKNLISAQQKQAEAQAKFQARVNSKYGGDESARGVKNTTEWKNLQQAIKEADDALKQYNDAKTASDSVVAQTKQVEEIAKLEKGYEEATKALSDFQKQQKNNPAGLADQIKQLQATKIDWSQYGVDLSKITSINQLNDALNKVQQQGGKNAAETLKKVEQNVKAAGDAGDKARQGFDNATHGLDEMYSKKQQMEQLKNQILQVFSIGNAVQIFRRAVQNAFQTIKQLDKAMTEIAVVSKYSVDEMWDTLPEFTKNAQAMGATIEDTYKATTLYVQQGLEMNKAIGVSNETLKMARIAGMDAAQATDAMTAALRGFNMEVDETNAQQVNDVFSKLAAVTAADTSELSTAMSKVASIASSANMELETTTAFLSQIIETTREAPETAGTALKTVIARFGEVKDLYSKGEVSGEDSEGEQVDVNKIQKALRSAGVDMTDFLLGNEGLDQVFMDLSAKWDSLDVMTQRYIATVAAGSRQQSRFIALMSDNARMTELVNTAHNSAGASQEQFNKTLDSMESKLNNLSSSWQSFTMGIADSSALKGGVDVLTAIMNAINGITDALPGPMGGIAKIGLLLGGLNAGSLVLKNTFRYMKDGNGIVTALGKSFVDLGTSFKNGFLKFVANFKAPKFNVNVEGLLIAEKTYKSLHTSQKNQLVTLGAINAAYEKNNAEQWEQLWANEALDQNTKEQLGAEQIKTFQKQQQTRQAIAQAIVEGKLTQEQLDQAVAEGAITEQGREQLVQSGLRASLIEKIGKTQKLNWLLGKFDIQQQKFLNQGKLFQGLQEKIIGKFKDQNIGKTITQVMWEKVLGKARLASLGIFIAIIAAVTIITAMLINLGKNYSLDGKLEATRGALDKVNSALDKTNDSLQKIADFKTKFEELNDELNNLTKNSLEWQQKLLEINDTVYDTASALGIVSQIKMTSDGMYYLEEGDLAEAQREQLAAKQNQMQVQQQLEIEIDVLETTKKVEQFQWDNFDALGWAKYDSKQLQTLFENAFELAQIDDVDAFNAKLTELGISLNVNASNIDDFKNALMEMGDDVTATSMAMKSQQQQILNELDISKDISEAVRSTANLEYDKISKEWSDLASFSNDAKVADAGWDAEHDKEYLRKYLEIIDPEGINYKMDGDNAGILKRTDEGGWEVDKELKWEEVLHTIGANEAIDGFTTAAEEAAKRLEAIAKGEIYTSEEETLVEAGFVSLESEAKEAYVESINQQQLELSNRRAELQSQLDNLDPNSILAETLRQDIFNIDEQIENLNGSIEELNDLTFNFETNKWEGTVSTDVKGIVGEITDADIQQITDEIYSATETLGISAADTESLITSIFAGDYSQIKALGLNDEELNQLIPKIDTLIQSMVDSGEYSFDWYDEEKGAFASIQDAAEYQTKQIFERFGEGTTAARYELGLLYDDILAMTSAERNALDEIQQAVNATGGSIHETWALLADAPIEAKEAFAALAEDGIISEIEIDSFMKQNEEMGWGIQATTEELNEATNAANDFTLDKLKEELADFKTLAEKLGIDLYKGEKDTFSQADITEMIKQGLIVNGKLLSQEDFHMVGIDTFILKTPIENLEDALRENTLALIGKTTATAEEELAIAQNIADWAKDPSKWNEEWKLPNGGSMTMGEVLSKIGGGAIGLENSEEHQGNKGVNISEEELVELALQLGIEKPEDTKSDELYNTVREKINKYWADGAGVDNAQAVVDEQDYYTTNAKFAMGSAQDVINSEEDKSAQREYLSARIQAEEYQTVLQQITKDLKKQNPELKYNNKLLQAQTIDYVENHKAIDNLVEVLGNQADALGDTNKKSVAHLKALQEVAKAATEVFGVQISTDFVESNLSAFQAISEGGQEAQDAAQELGLKLASSYAESISSSEEMTVAFQELINTIDGENIEIGSTHDFTGTVKALLEMGATAEQVARTIESMGYEVSWKWKTSDLPQWNPITGQIINPGTQYPVGRLIVTKKNFSGVGKSSGGGGGSSDKPEKWENPYDEYFNISEKINESIRERELLESKLSTILDKNSTSVAEVADNYEAQLNALRTQLSYQKQLLAGRKKQIQNSKNTEYLATRKNGDEEEQVFTTYQKQADYLGMGNLDKYVKYNFDTNTIDIDWSKIEAIEDKTRSAEMGELIEAYVDYLTEKTEDYEDIEKTLLDIENEIKDQIDEIVEQRVSFIETMATVMSDLEQRRIDDLQALSDELNDTNDKILSSLQESIDLERQIRDNTETEDEIADMEARLAYLRRDTSGANDQEIYELEKELAEKREDYGDTRVDQEIERLEKANEEASEQRERQIELLQAILDYQIESGYFKDLADAMEISDKNRAYELWKERENYRGLTEEEKTQKDKEFNEKWNTGLAGKNSGAVAASEFTYSGQKYIITDKAGRSDEFTYDSKTGQWISSSGKTKLDEDIITEWDNDKNTAKLNMTFSEGRIKSGTALDIDKESDKPQQNDSPSKSPSSGQTYPHGKASETTGNIKIGASGKQVQAIQYALNKLGYGNVGTKTVDGKFGENTKLAVQNFQRAMGLKLIDGIVGTDTRAKFKAKGYKTGGLADYTGPAWLDGTPSRPELILNARDTENFIQLKDVLSGVMKNTGSISGGGDNYFDINIVVDEISNDYDVDKLAARIKQQINDDATYRNVNAINFIR